MSNFSHPVVLKYAGNKHLPQRQDDRMTREVLGSPLKGSGRTPRGWANAIPTKLDHRDAGEDFACVYVQIVFQEEADSRSLV